MTGDRGRPSKGVVPPPPQSEDEYGDWLIDRCKRRYDEDEGMGIDDRDRILQREQEVFDNVAELLRVQFQESFFWAERLWPALRDRHSAATLTAYGLLAHPNQAPVILKKSWEPLVLKSYRRNVLDNSSWPDPPPGGWVLPDNWFECVSDVVRTTVVVRYLDGIEMVRQAIEDAAVATGTKCDFDFENRDEGYYALHVTAWLPFRFISLGYQSATKILPVEIQVCTQVQEVLRTLTHKTYEATRRRPRRESDLWQWRWQCAQFTPNYLGHILHFADGVMLSLRGKVGTE